jgi:dienelactone hydrolase
LNLTFAELVVALHTLFGDIFTRAARNVVLIAMALVGYSGAAHATPCIPEDQIVQDETFFTAYYKEKGKFVLVQHEVMWVRPMGDGPFPLAVISHGAPRNTSDNSYHGMRPHVYYSIAEDMARRGWASAIFMRRGYGASSGRPSEGYGGCSHADFIHAGFQTAMDFSNAISVLSKSKFVDPRMIIAIGHSAGGFGVLALSGQEIPGLRAVINFGGGRASISQNFVCERENLLDAFREFGVHSRMPSLWVYAINDQFFDPGLAQEFFGVFSERSSLGWLNIIADVPGDGHAAIQSKGRKIWRPILDKFLDNNQLRNCSIEPH